VLLCKSEQGQIECQTDHGLNWQGKLHAARSIVFAATSLCAACALLHFSMVRDRNTTKIQTTIGLSEFHKADLYKKNYYGQEGMWCVGLNIVGFDLGATMGRNSDYTHPRHDQIEYFQHQGANCFRLAVTWERLQSRLGSEDLDPVDGIEQAVDFITNYLGDHVVIDPHNNDEGLRYNNKDASRSDFVNLWKAITKKWGKNPKCIFGLYNEPRYGKENGKAGYFDPNDRDYSGEMIEFWQQWMQEAIYAVRALGSKNLILVPGLHWTTCTDWAGAGWWGETIDGRYNQGNTRLAALVDPENHIAYDVHQYMDPKFTGEQRGCKGHDANFYCMGQASCTGADYGLPRTIAWAKKYKKKLIMTEIGSWPGQDGSEEHCKRKLHSYLQTMHDSGVFIGYLVWQFGCTECLADQWAKRPLNLDWYRFGDFGATCHSDHKLCRYAKCCKNPNSKCYEKNEHWASCRSDCKPGIHPQDPPDHRTNWTCNILKCSDPHEDCSNTRCCNDRNRHCYRKNDYWATCKKECAAGKLDMNDPEEHRQPGKDEWHCTVLSCSHHGYDCKDTRCCVNPEHKCYKKNEHWAMCRRSCKPGEVWDREAEEYQTKWSCEVLTK